MAFPFTFPYSCLLPVVCLAGLASFAGLISWQPFDRLRTGYQLAASRNDFTDKISFSCPLSAVCCLLNIPVSLDISSRPSRRTLHAPCSMPNDGEAK